MSVSNSVAIGRLTDENGGAQAPVPTSVDRRVADRAYRTLSATSVIACVAFVLIAVLLFFMWTSMRGGSGWHVSDLLAAVLPVVAGGLTALFTLIGFNRLKNFDERQDAMRKDIKQELTEELPLLMQKERDEARSAMLADIKDAKQDVAALVEASSRETSRLLEQAPWLRDIGANMVDWNQLNGNVAWVHDFVTARFAETSGKNDGHEIRAAFFVVKSVVDAVCHTDSTISGDPDDYHNLATVLVSNNQLDMAVDVIKKGLAVFPQNTDLLADLIFYRAKAGHRGYEQLARSNNVDAAVGATMVASVSEEAAQQVSWEEKELTGIERTQWNWRAFTFYIDALNMRRHTPEQFKTTMVVVEDYLRCLPTEERAYYAKYETLEAYGFHDAAVQTLITAEAKLSMTAQCSLRLASIHKMNGEYEAAIRSATRAIIGQAESQPSSNQAAAFAERAYARDAMLQMRILQGNKTATECAEDIQLAIDDYRLALGLGYHLPRQLERRTQMLIAMLPADGAMVAVRKELERPADDEDEQRKRAMLRLFFVLDEDQERMDTLLSGLRELSPITDANHFEYDALIHRLVAGDAQKAAEIDRLVTLLFTKR